MNYLINQIYTCKTYQYDYLPTSQNAALRVVSTISALNFYVGKKKDVLLNNICEFNFNIDLEFKVATMQFHFNNFHIPVADIVDFYFDLQSKSPYLTLVINQLSVKMAFDFVIRQQTYPYFEDVGFGYFQAVVDIVIKANPIISETCKYMWNYATKSVYADLTQIRIFMESPHSFLYQSFSKVIESICESAFYDLTDEIGVMVVEKMNQVRNEGYSNHNIIDGNLGFAQDARRYQIARVTEELIYVEVPGYFCNRNDDAGTCSGIYHDDNIILERPQIQSNWDYQIYQHRNLIDSFFGMVQNQLGMLLVVDQDTGKIVRFNKAIHVKTLVNMGMVVEFDFDYQGENHHFDAFVRLEGKYYDHNKTRTNIRLSMKYETVLDYVLPDQNLIFEALQTSYYYHYIGYNGRYCQDEVMLQIIDDDWLGLYCNFHDLPTALDGEI